MKVLHWKAVNQMQIKGTIWEGVKDDKVFFDPSEFEKKFSIAKPAPRVAVTDKKAPAAAPAVEKKQQISLIDAKRAYNISIALARFRMSHAAIRDAVLACDEKVLDEDKISALLLCAPQQDEIDQVMSYDGDLADLAPADHFFRVVSAVPRLELRLKLWHFKLRFPTSQADADKQLTLCENVLKALRSPNVKQVLEIALSLGNFLNFNTKGFTAGFALETINKLKGTKANDNKWNLLHYLVHSVAKHCPGAREFVDELSQADAASRVEMAQLSGEVGKMVISLRQIDAEMKKLENNTTGDLFPIVMRDFHAAASKDAEQLNERVKALEAEAAAVATYFGEDASSLPMATLVQIWATFVQDWKAAENFLEQERQAAERAAKREEQKRKMEAAAEEKKALRSAKGAGDGAVDKTLAGLTSSDSRSLMKMVQERRKGMGTMRGPPDLARIIGKQGSPRTPMNA